MGQDWIIHVLSDLRQFARQNELPMLSAQLDEALLTAAVEIAGRSEGTVATEGIRTGVQSSDL